jgi:hypothetical protein
MPHTFWHARYHPWIVGQDCILRAGFQPVLVGLFTSDSGGLPTRRTQRVPLQTCPAVLAEFQVLEKVCGIGRFRVNSVPALVKKRLVLELETNGHERTVGGNAILNT